MKWISPVLAIVVLGGCGREPLGSIDAAAGADELVVVCDVTATGTLPAGDSFDGAALQFADASSTGSWTHVTPEHDTDLCASDDANPGHCEHGNGLGVGHVSHGNGIGNGHDKHHTGRARDVFVGDVTTMSCLADGHASAFIDGEGTWNGVPGYTFEAEVTTTIGGSPSYEIHIYDPSAVEVYATGPLTPSSGTIGIIGT